MATIYMLCGKVGSGKSTYAQNLKSDRNTFVLSYDELMLVLFDDCIGPAKHQDMVSRCKKFLFGQALQLLEMNIDVVLDFGFWTKSEREETKKFFSDKNIEVKLHYINPPYEVITEHLEIRNKAIDQGLRGYYMTPEKRKRFDSFFQEPSKEEIDKYIE
ncbi:MAG: ATP-binding protein [Clostridium sp.]|uniref:AAA family ATPase n=1 Tax=Clostridium sp. TaxID=1506 RepID=UPI002A8888DC|nr:ATP-binding protein [Clostridium sp.]MDY5098432.1 ATP-binding protein [Clostridium sp.]